MLGLVNMKDSMAMAVFIIVPSLIRVSDTSYILFSQP